MISNTSKQEKTIIMSEIMTPNMANFTGNIHGGYLLSFLDKVAYACSARYAGAPTVTLSVDRVFFKEPIYIGELVSCYAMVNYVGKSSMEVGIKVIAENLQTKVKRHTNTCYFTMVAVDAHTHKPINVPALVLQNDIEKRRHEEAQLRRDIRLKFNEEHTARKKT